MFLGLQVSTKAFIKIRCETKCFITENLITCYTSKELGLNDLTNAIG